MRLLTACLLTTLALPLSAQVYMYQDAKGNTVFTDQPPEGTAALPVDLPPTNTVNLQAGENTLSPDWTSPTLSEGLKPYVILDIKGIGDDDDALRANNGTFNVSINIDPALAEGQTLRLLLDGQPYGQASTNTEFTLTDINRGEHTLAVQVLSGDTVVQQSAAQSFTVQRISVHSPARQ